MAKKTQAEVYTDIEELIPGNLWIQYNHLTFGEMSCVPELEDYATELKQAEVDWWAACE